MQSLLTAYEAWVLDDLLLVLLFGTEIGEGVDDDAEDQVQDNDDDDEEEDHVVDDPGREEGLLQRVDTTYNRCYNAR